MDKMQTFRFLLFYWILGLSHCEEVTWNCNYKYLQWSNIKNEPYKYTCDLESNTEYPSELTTIEGQHQAEMSDDDVKYLQVYSDFRKFSSIFCEKFKNLEAIRIFVEEAESIDEDSLQNCKNLEIIDLRSNKFVVIPQSLLSKNSKLTKVNITTINLKSLPENFFQSQIKLEKLFLWNHGLTLLPSKIFQPLLNLQYLELYDLMLYTLKPEWFADLRNLTELILEYNRITEVPEGAFKSLVNLRILNLEDNKIKTLRPDSFDSLQKLESLKLNDNNISELPKSIFAPLSNLRELYLSDNKLTTVHSDSFGFHKSLTKIYFLNNEITAVDEKVFDKIAVEKFNIGNKCYSGFIGNRSEINEKLRKCFDNYKLLAVSNCQISTEGNVTKYSPISSPWFVAVESTNGKFLCTGTLVTSIKVVTAAHCIQNKNFGAPILATDIKVQLDIPDSNDQNKNGRTTHVVESIHVHPDWNPNAEQYDADIAVLVLYPDATLEHNIKPINLFDHASNIAPISHGFVVAFKENNDEDVKYNKTVIDVSILSNEDCYQKFSGIQNFTSERTFCAGLKNGTGVFTEDNGNGLYVSYEGSYYLRGIASVSFYKKTSQCDVVSNAIFTDMMKFTDWVNGISYHSLKPQVDGNIARFQTTKSTERVESDEATNSVETGETTDTVSTPVNGSSKKSEIAISVLIYFLLISLILLYEY